MKKRWEMSSILTILILIVILVIIILLTYYLWDYLSIKNTCQKMFIHEETSLLTFLKCQSLCPTQVVDGETTIRQDCMLHCANLTNSLRGVVGGHSSHLDCGGYLATTFMKKYFEFSRKFMSCFKVLTQETPSSSQCVDELAEKYEVDLSDVKLGEYQKYEFSVERLEHSNGLVDIDVKLIEGTDNMKIGFVFIDEQGNYEGSASRFGDRTLYDAPKVGETKNYKLTPESQSISEVDLFLLVDENPIILRKPISEEASS